MIRVPEKWTTDQRIAVISLSTPMRSADGDQLGALVPDPRADHGAVVASDECARVRAALATMPRRDALVLRLRHGIRDDDDDDIGDPGYTMSLAEVARVLRVTRERIRQIEKLAQARLGRRLRRSAA